MLTKLARLPSSCCMNAVGFSRWSKTINRLFLCSAAVSPSERAPGVLCPLCGGDPPGGVVALLPLGGPSRPALLMTLALRRGTCRTSSRTSSSA